MTTRSKLSALGVMAAGTLLGKPATTPVQAMDCGPDNCAIDTQNCITSWAYFCEEFSGFGGSCEAYVNSVYCNYDSNGCYIGGGCNFVYCYGDCKY